MNGDVGLGMAYDSLSIGTGAPQDAATSAAGYGWTQVVGWGVALFPQASGAVIYQGPGGLTGTFTPVSGSTTAFTSPGGIKADLVKTTSGYTVSEHASNQVMTFTTAGVLSKIADRNGNATTVATSNGLPTSITSSRGATGARTATVTSTAGQITKLTQTSGTSSRSVSYAYTSGDLTSVIDALGRVTTFSYTNHELTGILAPGGVDTKFTYDTSHRVRSITQVNTTVGSSGNAVTSLTYNADSTLVHEPDQGPTGAAVTYTLTSDGSKRVASVVDAAGRSRATTYNANFDALTSAQGTGATGSTVTSTYGANNGESLTSVKTPGGATSSFGYANTAASTKYLATSATDDAGNQSLFTYNGAGNQLTATDATGAQASLTYNTDGTVATAAAPGNGTNVTEYTYDAAGRLATRTDPAGSATYGYDQMGRLTSVVNSIDAVKTSYTYDKSSNLATSVGGAGTTTYGYDAGNALTSMLGQRKFYFVVDDQGRRTDTYMGGNGPSATNWAVRSHTDYDTSGRVTRVTADRKPATTDPALATRVTDLAYCYAAGSTAPTCSSTTSSDRAFTQWMKNNLTGQVATYTYDKARRLSGAAVSAGTDSSGAGIPAVTYAYTYDARGNRTSARTTSGSTTTQTRTHNPANQVTTAGFSYDAAGNLTADPSVGSMAYNSAGQMTSVTTGGTAYDYAGLGQSELIRHQTPEGTYGYSYGRTNALGLPIIEAATLSRLTSSAYLYNDEDGTPIGLTTSAGGQAMYVYDAQGSPVALIGDGNNTAFTYSFDPYGMADNTYTSGGQAIHQNPFLFTGGLQDRTTGWVKNGARYYSPTEGRWTQHDTIDAPLDPANANRYAYAGCNPVNLLDPTGRLSRSCGLSIGGTAFATASIGLLILFPPAGAGAIAASAAVAEGGYAFGIASVHDSCPAPRRRR
ncbi:RHS repeat domain-containing protein [Quadrisphaera sp. DSM 44207]|uniref:RHS repeat domain-containing protein n=1 Tax=Quadrisphaera sp. DSM 44207 TaxID=1881057 RepID=UPI000882108F|nr:RHS repeat-associated core domain-containing protein [Quadrisphaera sp. DSM 44207]SDQ72892.1 RHS repeat-associated core domain-containing protein [Quadrisphaera sp. DSM 44207]